MHPKIDPRDLTVGKLRKAMEGLDDSTPVVIDNESRRYRPSGDAQATTAVIDADGDWREDMYDSSGPLGQTDQGFRLKVLRINDM
jgi:hypothetical protein